MILAAACLLLAHHLAKELSMTRQLLVASTLLVFAAVTWGADDPADRQVTLKKGDRIIFFGDSLTSLAGQEAPKDKGVTKGYVRIVRETLKEKHPDKDIEVNWV